MGNFQNYPKQNGTYKNQNQKKDSNFYKFPIIFKKIKKIKKKLKKKISKEKI